MNIRLASASDIPAMHDIRLAVRENRLDDPDSLQPEDYGRRLEVGGRGWVAEVDGRIAGFAVGDSSNGSVWALFVDPACEGLGIGRALHDVMVAWLFATGHQTLRLSTTPGTRAERFYLACGWIPAGYEPNGEARFTMASSSRGTGRDDRSNERTVSFER